MANFLSFLFGSKYPSTANYEAQLQQLYADRNRYTEFENSPIFKKFLQLDETVNSGDFEKKVNYLKTAKFEQTEAYQKLKKHTAIKKSKDFKTYLNFVESGKDKKLDAILISAGYIEMKELEAVVNSTDYIHKMRQKGFSKTDDALTLHTLKSLKKQSDIKFAIKTLNSSNYNTYLSVLKSARLQEFNQLDDYLNSHEYNEIKEFMHDKDRFKKSDEHRLLIEYNEIKNSSDYKWYIATKAKYPFAEIDKWEPTFEDDFDSQKLDTSRWMTGYYWGKALLNDNYVLQSEKQFFTDKNIELRDSLLRITTRNENCNGKVWDPQLGFRPSTFEYTSGLVNTGHAFRQQYGKFMVKMRVKNATDVNHAFWLLGEKMVPQITATKTTGKDVKTVTTGTVTGNSVKPLVVNQNYKTPSMSEFQIITLEWLPNKLVWSVNGVKIGEQTQGIPCEPMYLIFSSHVTDLAKTQELPVTFEIDWVKAYQLKN